MEKIFFSEIAGLFSAEVKEDFEILNIVTDTRKIEKGCLFVALKGDNFDGNDFVEEAFSLGARAAVSDRNHDDSRIITVSDTKAALGKIAAWYRRRFDIIAVAVTGSVGKTTTKQFISSVLSEKYKTLKTEGNLNNEIGLPLTIFNLDSSYKAAVFELGMNNSGEIERLSNIAGPSIAVITNVGMAHIENLGSRENIAKAKLEIVSGLAKDGALIISGDEPLLVSGAANLWGKTVSFGEGENCDYRAESIFEVESETDFVIACGGEKNAANIGAIGKHNVQNALAAAAVGEAAGLSMEEIIRGLSKFENTGGRQKIYDMGNIRLIDDSYNANPDSMKAGLSVLAGFDGGTRFAILSDMLELGQFGEQSHLEVGRIAAQNCDVLLAFGNDAKFYIDGAKEKGMEKAFFFDSPEEIAKYLAENAYEGDTLLFKASRGMAVERVLNALVKAWKES